MRDRRVIDVKSGYFTYLTFFYFTKQRQLGQQQRQKDNNVIDQMRRIILLH